VIENEQVDLLDPNHTQNDLFEVCQVEPDNLNAEKAPASREEKVVERPV